MVSKGIMERPKWLRRKEFDLLTPFDSSQVTERGRERFNWKKTAINLGLTAVGGALGWVTGGVFADSVFVFGDIYPLRHLAFQFAGVIIGMSAGRAIAVLETYA